MRGHRPRSRGSSGERISASRTPSRSAPVRRRSFTPRSPRVCARRNRRRTTPSPARSSSRPRCGLGPRRRREARGHKLHRHEGRRGRASKRTSPNRRSCPSLLARETNLPIRQRPGSARLQFGTDSPDQSKPFERLHPCQRRPLARWNPITEERTGERELVRCPLATEHANTDQELDPSPYKPRGLRDVIGKARERDVGYSDESGFEQSTPFPARKREGLGGERIWLNSAGRRRCTCP